MQELFHALLNLVENERLNLYLYERCATKYLYGSLDIYIHTHTYIDDYMKLLEWFNFHDANSSRY